MKNKIVSKLICLLFGHKLNNNCDWGFGFNGEFDIWCKRCDKMVSMPLEEMRQHDELLYYKARKKIYDMTGEDINNEHPNKKDQATE